MLMASSAKAQDIKHEAATTAGQLEAPKPADSQSTPAGTTDSKADNKQEPVKTPPSGNSKTDKKDSTDGNTRMAITEQGMPKKNKKQKKAAAGTTAPPAEKKKEEAPKK